MTGNIRDNAGALWQLHEPTAGPLRALLPVSPGCPCGHGGWCCCPGAARLGAVRHLPTGERRALLKPHYICQQTAIILFLQSKIKVKTLIMELFGARKRNSGNSG